MFFSAEAEKNYIHISEGNISHAEGVFHPQSGFHPRIAWISLQ